MDAPELSMLITDPPCLLTMLKNKNKLQVENENVYTAVLRLKNRKRRIIES